ncbi:cell envelope integrity protein CreD [Pontibacter sp. Tf4]|uniref:cell envelope integrity protein CreD n=1 Tax=Pontibacter sp. Tf4 TaxID=2761620 RepID=UPI00162491F9|nr:cell envelope integrity protein CreD [Pontibacter sp. Tf4]MBB6611714.1 cell envelope integrity protein CreD [Pontibacter sp. Tf4]
MSPTQESFLERNAVVVKATVIFVLVLLLLIPSTMIQGLIQEREMRKDEAIREISAKWGEQQTITGPVLTIPYLEFYRDTNKVVRQVTRYMHFLPDELKVNGQLFPEKRYRGIYEVVVYNSDVKLTGNFPPINFANLGVPQENLRLQDAFLSVGITDLRGIKEQVTLHWNTHKYSFNPGVASSDVLASGINAPVSLTDAAANAPYSFSLSLNLKGSEFLYFVPVGKETNVQIGSNWQNPSFDGAFLPDQRQVGQDGFTATWKVLHLNRNFPQQWKGAGYDVGSAAFGVNLLLPIDSYQKSMRSVKYAILFIGLTFLIFFFIELLHKKSVHPFQYVLIGLALCIFYTLLVSISEYSNFNIAYLIASIMTIGLVTVYTYSVFSSKKLAALVGGTLVILYAYIFTIIQLQDFALLMGSLGLFLILALVMYYSRKVDWYNIGRKNTGTTEALPKE